MIILRAQLFGPAAAVLHNNCFSRAIASLARRVLKIRCIGYYDDFGIVAPGCLIGQALGAFAELNEALLVALRDRESEPGPFLEFSGLAVSFRGDGGDVVASLALPEENKEAC